MDRSYDGGVNAQKSYTTAPTSSAPNGRPSFEPKSPRLRRSAPRTATLDEELGDASQHHNGKHNHFGQHGAGQGGAGGADNWGSGRKSFQPERPRKGSIRNAMKKMFGRRSREVQPLSPASRHFGHQHNRSEAPTLETQHEESPEYEESHVSRPSDGALPTQIKVTTFPIPMAPLSLQDSSSRTGSPYAVQFPNSVRLKPMDLGNPFGAPGSQLRRRKTLPSVQHAAAACAPATAATTLGDKPPDVPSPLPDVPPTFDAGSPRAPGSADARSTNTSKHTKRKSRSLDDLRAASAASNTPPRQRSEEIQYWRDSLRTESVQAHHQSVDEALKARSQSYEAEDDDGQLTPLAQVVDTPNHQKVAGLVPSQMNDLQNTPPHSDAGGLGGDRALYSPADTEMSRDLEERVARLEAGLQNFQRSLQHMTSGSRQRKAAAYKAASPQTRAYDDLDTPSMLADTLQHTLAPSSYEYEYGHTMRPATSPRSSMLPAPQTPPRHSGIFDSFGPRFSTSSFHRHHPSNGSSVGAVTTSSRSLPNAYRNPSPPPPLPTRLPVPPTSASHTPSVSTALDAALLQADRNSPIPQHTFRSLYQMLADERSARRKLESQLKSLQREISDLHNQVAFSSASSVGNPHSQRNSAHAGQYVLNHGHYNVNSSSSGDRNDNFSSSRLRELLKEVEQQSSDRHEHYSPHRPYPYPHDVDLERSSAMPSHSDRYTHQRPALMTFSQNYPALPAHLSAHAASLQAQPVVSRFSGSESEAGITDIDPEHPRHTSTRYSSSHHAANFFDPDDDDIPTPYEAYQTPREERSRGSDSLDVGLMF